MRLGNKHTRYIDWYIVLPLIYLAIIGVVIQTSIANKASGVSLDLNIGSQLVALGVGIGAFIFMGVTNWYAKRWFSATLYLLSLLLLAAVYLIGVESNGSQRWIGLGGLQFQPTELAKFSVVLVLAHIFNTKDVTVNRLKTILGSLVVVALPAALIVIQPDLGSAIVLFVIWLGVLFTSRLKLSRFTLVMLLIAGSVAVAVPFLAEYQQERLVSYFNQDKDTSGSSYNVEQARIAIGSGGAFGSGVESGSQSQLNFLPSQHTDFIFAVTAEKLGFFGALSVLIAFCLIVIRMSYIAWLVRSQLQRAIVVGVMAFLMFHIFVNIGMNVGLVPVTGLPLPLLSYGGTFSFVVLLSLGAVSRISVDERRARSEILKDTLQM